MFWSLIKVLHVITICFGSERHHSLIGTESRQDSYISNFRSNVTGIVFSGVFSNNTVLQREPHHAAIYGICDRPNISITLIIIDEEMINNANEIYTAISMSNGDWKIILNKTYVNGGNYTFIVECKQCFTNNSYQSLYNITFGDVFFCAGQSNMKLEIKWTFSQNYTYNNITQLHKYSNIRFYEKSALITNDTTGYIIPSHSHKHHQYQWHQSYNIEFLKEFSATCWYYAQSLVDKYKMNDINFGLITASIGGTMIEGWIMNNTISDDCNTQIACPDIKYGDNCGAIYNGMIRPFINMTIKGIIWYQGENNLFEGNGGNWRENTGYSCLQKIMIEQWRSNWSIISNTTDPMVPFGIVQLVAGSDEGYSWNMPSFRWAQQFNDILPIQILPNIFIAQTYDIGDPWDFRCSLVNRCKSPAPYNIDDEKWKMGPIHARTKIYVGQRLAMGANKFIYNNNEIWQGPVIKICYLYDTMIRCVFNESMLYDEHVIVQPFKLWYNKSLEKNVEHWTSFEILINDGIYRNEWIYIDDNTLSIDSNGDGHSIIIDVSDIVDTIIGIRYAWNTWPCCGTLNRTFNPCPPISCPIVTSKSKLPAMPFSIDIVNKNQTNLIFNIVIIILAIILCCCCCFCVAGIWYYFDKIGKKKNIEISVVNDGDKIDAMDVPFGKNEQQITTDFSCLNENDIEIMPIDPNEIKEKLEKNKTDQHLIEK